jgi:general secretion pathway protein C
MLLVRSLSWLVWAVVALSAVAWGLRWVPPSAGVPPQAVVAERRLSGGGDLSRLFGVAAASAPSAAAAALPAADARFKLLGVVAPRASAPRQGLALIAVDGQAPRALRVGASLDERWTLLAVRHRQVDLGPSGGPTALTLELPALAEALRGQPPSVAFSRPQGAGAPAAPLPPVGVAPQQPAALFGHSSVGGALPVPVPTAIMPPIGPFGRNASPPPAPAEPADDPADQQNNRTQ